MPQPPGTVSRNSPAGVDVLTKALPHSAALKYNLDAIVAVIPNIESDLKKSQEGGAIALARAFVAFHRLKAQVDEAFKPFDQLFNDYKNRVLPEAFDHEGVTSVPLAEGFRVGVSAQLRASIRPDEKEAAYLWLKDNGFESLITETVNAGTLSAAARSMLDDKGVELPNELFNVAFLPTTSVTSTK